MSVFDLAVIGAGPGGLEAALHAQAHGLKTVLIDKKDPGGTCLHTGCIPTKALLSSSRFYDRLKRIKSYGLQASEPAFDWPSMLKRKDEIVAKLLKGAQTQIEKSGLTWVQGAAKFKAVGALEISGERPRLVEAKNIIIATGSEPASLPGVAFDSKRVFSSDQILNLKALPERMLIIGGGAIGVEFASLFHALGVDITLCEMLDRLLPQEDPDCSKRLENLFTRRGIQVMTSAKLTKLDASGSKSKAVFEQKPVWEGDVVLVGVGRKRNSAALNLERIKAACEKNGAIRVDEHMETTSKGVFAIGDVTQSPQLAHTAAYEGLLVVNNILNRSKNKVNYHANPNAVYSDPEIASVGIEQSLRLESEEKAFSVRIPFAAVSKAQVEGEPDGFMKLYCRKGKGTVIGASAIGAHVTELLPELVLAVRLGLHVRDLAQTIHAHPTESEIIQLAAGEALKQL